MHLLEISFSHKTKRFLSAIGILAFLLVSPVSSFGGFFDKHFSNLLFAPDPSLDIQPNNLENCGAFNAGLTIIGSEVGVSYQIFDGATPSGSPVIGTGGTIVVTSGVISASTILSVEATETFGAMESAFLTETIPVTISQNPTTSFAGNNQVNCGLSIALNANNPLIGTGQWSLVSGPGTASFANANVRNTVVTVSGQGSYTFQWAITNGVCPPSTSTVTITFFAPPTPADAGVDQLVCGLSANLQGNTPTNGNGAWFLVSGPGGASFENSTDPNTALSVFVTGSYTLQWIIFNGVCPFSSDQVVVTFTTDETLADAGADQSLCALSANLSANNPGGNTAFWTVVSGPGNAVFSDINDPNASVTVDAAGVYILSWSIDNSPCPISVDEVSIELTQSIEICDGIDNDCDTFIDEDFDVDADGFTSCNGDCDDNDNTVYPGAPEICDGIDNNCDTQIDEGVQITFYADADGDGFGDLLAPLDACIQPVGYVLDNTDCDDTDFDINPGVAEICDGFDNNCNTLIDEGVQTTYYADMDGDGFGDALNTIDACTQPVGFVLDNTDCDDADFNVNPSAIEICDGIDNNCDTQIDEGVLITYFADTDGDGFGDALNTQDACTQPVGFVLDNTDCDDTDFNVNPSATEICDGIDNDCDTQIDEGVQITFFADTDGDGFGDPLNTILDCVAPVGYVVDNTDCDDTDFDVNPAATEICDGIDNDCDTQIDETGNIVFYADTDGDGFGDPLNTTMACVAPIGFVSDNTDCDDTNFNINPAAAEICDGIDNNCDTQIDEGVLITYYADGDGDGFGDALNSTDACAPPLGFVLDNTDCDDTNFNINPSALEICDGIDNNCDTQIDEGVLTTYFADADGDGFGDPLNTQDACAQPVGFVLDNTDCDDTDFNVNPSAIEVCDGIDNNCDTQIDEGVQTVFFADTDGDGFGDPLNTILDCVAPIGYVVDNTDCDDTDFNVNPAATEICDGIDNDCDTQIDETGNIVFYADTDGDGFGDPLNTTLACVAPVGFVSDNTDCDDTNFNINPAAIEICDGIDNNCDVVIDDSGNTYYIDADGDGFGDPNVSVSGCVQPVGYVTDNTDCDDTDFNINPAAIEICDGIDNNCDTQIDEGVQTVFFADTDGDGFGDPLNTILDCVAPVGYVSDNTDCDDTDFNVNPAATEICDGIDNDCDTQIDETGNIVFYADTDGDGFGDPLNTTLACVAPLGFVSDNTDCDDTNFNINPGVAEICDGIDNNCDLVIDDAGNTYYIDADGDGFGDPNVSVSSCIQPVGYVTDNTDCNDADFNINPSATEICDGVDNNCDTQIDEGVQTLFFADTDGDGFGDPLNTILACTQPLGYITDNTDCDDTNFNINTNATEVCDGVDNNCNTQIDEAGDIIFYADTDGDGFGDPLNTTTACVAPAGFVSDNTDCDDTDFNINPGALELCDGIDNNCNFSIDEGAFNTYYFDGDGDGFGDVNITALGCTPPTGYVADNTDCDDTNFNINPGATEICDGLDNNCNTQIDETGNIEFWADTDGDGYGDPLSSVFDCVAPTGFVANNLDCDDTNNAISPDAIEICDGIDNNCDTQIDETGDIEFFADTDGDGYGDPLNSILACTAPVGFVDNSADCDDTNFDISPDAIEVCDGVDNNCDTQIDETGDLIFFGDTDSDGFGDPNNTILACSIPVGYIDNDLDCDDTNSDIFPGAIELCDALDNNCDTQIDEGLTTTTYWLDADLDGFGDGNFPLAACVQPDGYVDNDFDCDDNDFNTNPNAIELCDGLDNNCDAIIDEGLPGEIFYADNDGDGFGNPNNTITACALPPGFTTDNTDCDDDNPFSYPGADEICDGYDNNCDGTVDEGFTLSEWYLDFDGDGFGDPNTVLMACAPPMGYTDDSSDCDDDDINTNPLAMELCDGIDNNCDNVIDEGLNAETFYADVDGDGFGDPNNTITACAAPVGYVSDNTDCDDANDAINPTATDVCDGIDNDCDLLIDEDAIFTDYYLDADGDGYGDVNNTLSSCSAVDGYVLNSLDCDDTNDAINPDAVEVCDFIDNNCDGEIDEGLFEGDCADTDGDGVKDGQDIDDDNDGILDTVEMATAQNNGDTDNDGIVDSLDSDSDGDGIVDAIEAGGTDEDGDGYIGSGPITDINGDGLEDSLEPDGLQPVDTDGDGDFDFQELDSDNDGVLDENENDVDGDGIGPDDTDGDGTFDFRDVDDDGDGIPTSVEFDYNGDGITPDDCDYDGIANYLDADQCEFFIPEGFSPNGDNQNDTFVLEGLKGGTVVSIQVYNRYGSLVYQSEDYQNDWDGRSSEGSTTGDLPAGTYYYVISVQGESKENVGYITLWR